MKHAVSFVALALVVAASPAVAQHRPAPTAAPAASPIEIEPGLRFGALRLGMTSAQAASSMPGVPLRPDTREFDRVDGSTGAFIGPFELEFAASGELRSIAASLHELAGGIRIGARVVAANATAPAAIAALPGCGSAVRVGGGREIRCRGVDVQDMDTAEGVRLVVHR